MDLSAFQQSAFLQALGWAIANNIWQCGILWLLYQIAVTSYNNPSAKFKNNLSTGLLFGNFLWFVVTFFNKIIYLRSYLPGSAPDQLLYSTNADLISGNISLLNFISPIVNTLPYLSLAYLLLLLIFAIKLINSYCNANFIKNNGLSKPGAEWRVFVEKVANHISISKKIKIWFSMYVDVPATIGFLKPVILIPLASLNQLTADQMEAIILHEISHIKRNDYVVNLFVSLIETILFFNPFVVLLSKIIKKERENCCDDFVLQYQYDRHSYASALLVLERYREQQFHLALAATSGRKQLLFRIKRIMEVKNSNDGLNYGQKLLALLLSTGIICSLAWLTPEKKSDQSSNKQLPGKISKKNLLNTTNKTIDSSLKYKDAKNILPFIQPQILKEERDNFNDISETTADAGSREENLLTFNIKNSQKDEEIEVMYGDSNEGTIPKKPADLNLLNTVNANFMFSPNSFFSDVKILDSINFDIDVNKLKFDIEKGTEAISSIDWVNIKELLQENFEKINVPKFKMSIKNEKIEFTTEKREFKEPRQRQLQLQTVKQINNTRNQRIRPQPRNSTIFSQDNDEADFFYDGAPADNFTMPPPPPPPPLKRKKYITVITPSAFAQPISRDEYTYQYHTSPKAKFSHNPSIHINYEEGAIIINGEKINLCDLKKSQAEKIIRKFILEDNKRMTGIQSKD